jgi:hypothetical protein
LGEKKAPDIRGEPGLEVCLLEEWVKMPPVANLNPVAAPADAQIKGGCVVKTAITKGPGHHGFTGASVGEGWQSMRAIAKVGLVPVADVLWAEVGFNCGHRPASVRRTTRAFWH